MIKYLVVDPGKSSGIATFDDKGITEDFAIARGLDELMQWLEEHGPYSVVIYEDYRLFGHKAMAQVGSRMETVQAIGVLMAFARKWKAEVHRQPPSAHKLGQMWG